jgi:hypothetical protein
MDLQAMLALRATHPDTMVLDVIELGLLLEGENRPILMMPDSLARRWGVHYGSVSWRISRLQKAGLIQYDKGMPGYWLWAVWPNVNFCQSSER